MINLENILFPEKTITRLHGEATNKAKTILSPTHLSWIEHLNDPAFLNYLVLTYLSYQLPTIWQNETSLVYNRYYWFLRFARVHGEKHEKDSGLQQQVFQILEQASSEIDWKVIEAIDGRVKNSNL